LCIFQSALVVVGAKAFSRQFGRNQAFNSAGNVFSALLIAFVSYAVGYRAIFAVAVVMSILIRQAMKAEPFRIHPVTKVASNWLDDGPEMIEPLAPAKFWGQN
jgi:hypothetical protein